MSLAKEEVVQKSRPPLYNNEYTRAVCMLEFELALEFLVPIAVYSVHILRPEVTVKPATFKEETILQGSAGN